MPASLSRLLSCLLIIVLALLSRASFAWGQPHLAITKGGLDIGGKLTVLKRP